MKPFNYVQTNEVLFIQKLSYLQTTRLQIIYIYIYIYMYIYIYIYIHSPDPRVEHFGEGINGCHSHNAKGLLTNEALRSPIA